MSDETKRLMIIAFSQGYHAGHGDTVEGFFAWCEQGTSERAEDWFDDAKDDGSFD